MRFQATHKLMSYLLVLARSPTLASSDALSALPALAFLRGRGAVLVQRRRAARPRALARSRCALPLRVGGGRGVSALGVAGLAAAARPRSHAGAESRAVPAGVQAVSPARQPRLPARLRPVVPDRARGGGDRAELPVRGRVRALRRARDLDADPLSPAPRDGRELPHQALEPGAEPEGRRQPHPELAARGRRIVSGGDRRGRAVRVRRLGGDVRAGAAHRRRVRARRPRTTRNMVGFSDEVALGQYGILSTDNQVVALRATIPRSPRCPPIDATTRSSGSTGAARSTTPTTAATGSGRGNRSCAPSSRRAAPAT